jgi:L-alanine-DL-glutamate epimerase-like enolase superfamily enzyme
VSAIETALWDIAGKAAGLAVHRMVGAMRDRVPAYASGINPASRSKCRRENMFTSRSH